MKGHGRKMLRYADKEKQDVDIDIEQIDTRMFDVEDDEKQRIAKRVQRRVQLNKDPNASPSKRGNWFVIIMAAAVTAAVFSFYIYGGIELNKVNTEIRLTTARNDTLRRENVRLAGELESKITLARVEEFVEEHGLVREQNLIVTHITVNIEDVIEIAPQPELDFFDKISAWFDEILSFLGF
jgi:hypothetical protein